MLSTTTRLWSCLRLQEATCAYFFPTQLQTHMCPHNNENRPFSSRKRRAFPWKAVDCCCRLFHVKKLLNSRVSYQYNYAGALQVSAMIGMLVYSHVTVEGIKYWFVAYAVTRKSTPIYLFSNFKRVRKLYPSTGLRSGPKINHLYYSSKLRSRKNVRVKKLGRDRLRIHQTRNLKINVEHPTRKNYQYDITTDHTDLTYRAMLFPGYSKLNQRTGAAPPPCPAHTGRVVSQTNCRMSE